jgi:5'-nucleotidase
MVNWNTKLIAASLLGCAVATGCGNANKKTAAAQKQAAMTPPMNQAALDVPAAPPAAAPAAPAVAFNPTPPQQPVVYDPATEQQPAVEEPAAEAYEPADFDERPVARARPARKPAPARVASASTGKTKYKVRKGESLWSIAEARYGNGHKWKAIAAANPRIDPNRVQAGQTITLP